MAILFAIHVFTVFTSLILFNYRAWALLLNPGRSFPRWIKVTPHLNDTILLISALLLSYQIQQYPFVHPWLTTKILALLAYIALGMMFMRRVADRRQGIVLYLLANMCFVFIVSVALSHNPFGFFAL